MTFQAKPGGATAVTVVRSGEGEVDEVLPGVGVVFKIDGDAVGGELSIVEHPFEVGALVPPHIHMQEDEISIVLEGEIGFRSEDQEVVLGSGSYIVKPRGQVHAMWNAGLTPARMIEVISPAGLEEGFREYAAMIRDGPPDPEVVEQWDQRYQVPSAEPDWLPEVIARYNLKPPPDL